VAVASLPSPMCSAALQYARRGWPVFPCRENDGEPYLVKTGARKGETRTPRAKAPYVGHGVSDATTDETTIIGWWKRWPNALIGLAMGRNGLFALDFDPRTDATTGEVWTLERLKAETEAQIGCEIPTSLAAMTPSGGVHVYLMQPKDGGAEIRNRGNLPLHVDVRGIGGYAIAPPSIIAEPVEQASIGRYSWLRGKQDAIVAEAPAQLIEILRAPKARPANNIAGGTPAAPSSSFASPSPAGRLVRDPSASSGPIDPDDAVQEAIRRYGAAVLDGEVQIAAAAADGTRNNTISACALTLGHLVGAGALTRTIVVAALTDVARAWPDLDKSIRSIESGVDRGAEEPRDLSAVIDKARERAARADRWRSRASSSHAPGPDQGDTSDQSFRMEGSGEGKAGSGSGGEDPAALDIACSWYPLTDMGNAERFRDRFGDDFRWSSALGWLGWDGRRWAVLDQDEKTVPAVLLGKVFDMVRAIQDEAEAVAETGIAKPLWLDDWEEIPEPQRYTLTSLQFAELGEYRRGEAAGNPLNSVIDVKKGRIVTRADKLREWGRTSEASGKLGCIANLIRPWLAASADAFDTDPLAINVLNGTLRFRRVRQGGDLLKWKAEWRLDPHDRADLITKLASVEFDRDALCPIYDDMFAWAQPSAGMRRYLHQWGGLSMTGDMGEQKLHFWYGRGGNGKSTVIDAWCAAIGDYTSTIGIETFLDQGVKKRGDQASPDLARLGGVRLLRTSEPEKGGKLAAALIKLVTGGEPMTVRFLNRGFFDLQPIFKLTISGNFRPEIPDTDDGIWRRVKLIPWDQRVRDEQHPEGTRDKDPDLAKKLRTELSGIFNRLIGGLLDWLENGLVEPSEVTMATQAYRSDSDPLGRFLTLCTRPNRDGRVQSSKLHAVFVAWCRAAGEREWSNKGLAKAMADKGFAKKASDGMQWLGIELIREVSDFIDHEGNPLPFSLPDDAAPTDPAQASARGSPSPWSEADDGLPP
jgi:putative DNA primase/helicase